MAHTLCFSGMDRSEEAKLKLLFADANEWLGGDWSQVPENVAEVLVIDLESIHGHMTWLKVQNSRRHVIALSSREQPEAEHLLLRPVTVESMVTALAKAIDKPVPQRQIKVSASDAMQSSQQAGAAAPQPVPHREAQVQPTTPPGPLQTNRAQSAPPQPSAPESTPAPAPRPAAPLVSKPREPMLWDYLQPGKLTGPSKMQLDDAPPLVIDPGNDTYIGGLALKPYIPYCELGSVRAGQWHPVSPGELRQHTGELGGPQPLARLRWLAALVQGRGELAPGYHAEDKFQLTRWPKTEREYPRHFRIATTMMQGPATLAEIAAHSNTTLQEVADFVNASLDSGFAEPYVPPQPPPDTPPPRSGSLLGRLRGRSG